MSLISETLVQACSEGECPGKSDAGNSNGRGGKSPMLSPNTKVNVTIAVFLSVAGAIMWATVYAVNLVNGINMKLDALASQWTDYQSNGYTRTAAAEISLRNAILNPGIYYADPRNPSGNPIYVDPTRGRPNTQH